MSKTKIAAQPQLLPVTSWEDYALVDSGDGRKLEQIGPYLLDRPEPSALWPKADAKAWGKASAIFASKSEDEEAAGAWQVKGDWPEQWPMHYEGLQFWGRRTTFRHIGLFPEQEGQWRFLRDAISAAEKPCRVLNLFGYTGVMSLVSAAAGAEVTHVDASKKAVAWGRENAEVAGLTEKPIRWIVEDARKYVAREVRRGSKYHGIILDPPKFGRGPDGDVWQFLDHVPDLLKDCIALLDDDAKFLILTGYNARLASRTLAELVAAHMGNRGGVVNYGDYTLPDKAGRQLGLALFARWQAQ